MATSRITYNSKTIDLGRAPQVLRVDARVPRVINTTLSGINEVITLPRVDVHVHIEIPQINSALLRMQMEDWWQWAQRGGSWSFAKDSSKTVSTTLTGVSNAGATLAVVSSATGIVNGQQYVLIDGPNYAVVTVLSQASTSITLTGAIDVAFGIGARFRDLAFWNGIIRNSDADHPCVDHAANDPSGQLFPIQHFDVILDFFEA